MKNALKLLALALLSAAFTSCCGLGLCSDSIHGEQKTTTYETVPAGPKGGMDVQVPVVTTTKVKHPCTKCGSSFCAKDCCGIISKQVLSRRTTQGSSGEPHLGLIPTMKALAPTE